MTRPEDGGLPYALYAAAKERADAAELAEQLSRAIAPVIAHDAVMLAGLSPATGSAASYSFWHRVEPGFGTEFLSHYYAGDDPWLPADFGGCPVPVAAMHTAGSAGGRRERLARRLLTAHGVGCQLRLLLRDARGVWGTLGLLRAAGGRPFDGTDLHRAARLGPALVRFLRTYVTAAPLAPATRALPPGVLVIGADHTIRTATPHAFAWKTQLSGYDGTPEWVSSAFVAGLAMQARAHARDPQAGPPPVVVGPAASYGRWVAVHGEALHRRGPDSSSGHDSPDVAVVIETARHDHILPSFCDWYGITARERQVLTLLCEATAPKQIARSLDLSPHTVNDHLKAIFRKTGATGRDELLAALI